MSEKNSMRSFDELATKMIIKIFDYLSHNDAACAFFCLNQRFRTIFFQYRRFLKSFTTPTRDFSFWQTILSTTRLQVEHLTITTIEFSLSLDLFPNLKTLVISSAFPIDYDEFVLLLKSEQFKNLNSLKIKSEIVKDIYAYEKCFFP